MAINFVVEDGTGLSNATSYISLLDAEQYVIDYVEDTTVWDAKSDDDKKRNLNIGARYIDAKNRGQFKGIKKLFTQSLEFPRYEMIDSNGFSIDSDSVPIGVAQANVELAIYGLTNGNVFANLDSQGPVKAERLKIDVLEIDTEWSGTKEASRVVSMVNSLLSEYLAFGGGVNAEVRRG